MSSFKDFFRKKKADIKFKLAGEGHKLTDSASKQAVVTTQPVPRASNQPTGAQVAAAQAALARLEKTSKPSGLTNRSLAAIRAQAKRELEEEQKALAGAASSSAVDTTPELKPSLSTQLATEGVLFQCPMIGPYVLPKKEIDAKIRESLLDQLKGEDAGLTSCLFIHTVNKNKEKVQACIETLCKYIDNIVVNPAEEKYRKIRVLNKVFQDRVNHVEGSKDFLQAAGFQLLQLTGPEGNEEDYYVCVDVDEGRLESLKILREALVTTEPIKPVIDRGLQVLLPSEALRRTELPDEFFNLTVEEIKREQQLKSQAAEQGMMLRTKAMREKEALREQRKYRYTLIRVRFPDGIILQGTFKVNERFREVCSFVQENLEEESRPFVLSLSGKKMSELDTTLLNLQLIPSVMLHFTWDPPCVETETGYLKEGVLALLRNM